MPGEYSSPLHPRALTSKELTFNRIVVLFNIYLGVLGEYCVVSTPENQERTIGNVAVISLKVLKTGVVIEYPLVNLGAQPYEDGSWNKAHFIIDRQFMSELPSQLVPLPATSSGIQGEQLRPPLHYDH